VEHVRQQQLVRSGKGEWSDADPCCCHNREQPLPVAPEALLMHGRWCMPPYSASKEHRQPHMFIATYTALARAGRLPAVRLLLSCFRRDRPSRGGVFETSDETARPDDPPCKLSAATQAAAEAGRCACGVSWVVLRSSPESERLDVTVIWQNKTAARPPRKVRVAAVRSCGPGAVDEDGLGQCTSSGGRVRSPKRCERYNKCYDCSITEDGRTPHVIHARNQGACL